MHAYFKTALYSTVTFVCITAAAVAAESGNIMDTMSQGTNSSNYGMGSSDDSRTINTNRLPSDSSSRAVSDSPANAPVRELHDKPAPATPKPIPQRH